MRKTVFFGLLAVLSIFEIGCSRCYVCSVTTDYGIVERDVCGRKSDVGNLISHLESDTTGNGPWVCEKD